MLVWSSENQSLVAMDQMNAKEGLWIFNDQGS